MRASFLSIPFAVLLGLVLLGGCTDPYLPEAIQNPPSYLVVDGFVNSKGATAVRLSRTYAIGAKTAPPAETKATVFVEEEGGARYPLAESPAGTYTSPIRTLNPARKYRLRINTADGQQYASGFEAVNTTPRIDDFSWRATPEGLKLLISTHNNDPAATRFYRWDYEETWESIPLLIPSLEYRNLDPMPPGGMFPITTRFPRICWGNEKSTDIKLVNTTRLSQNAVRDYVVRELPTTSSRLRHLYSILVTQAAQSEAEYRYWELLKKNTENIGTLFDPQPVQLLGNVRCLTDEKALALGFVGVHSMEQQRLFIRYLDLPNDWRISSGYDNCEPDTIRDPRLYIAYFGGPYNVPLAYGGGGVLGVDRRCVDCRLYGSTVKPSFWP
ncbi:DUF4249 domain-containing protein [Hymenobacter sp. BT523]|uniref:DUF4249 domain-containing protein n=1 Tax=Hymenobacter sp. BT523 TaxID=2795725 RepID=UPI0018EDA9EC|nr:DUF4249 domain-containing protein [Hymenobacter sp. BT523]MBJ6107467.1 DUF4249 domain-containing protein [Hymenobacter sp. BT523]